MDTKLGKICLAITLSVTGLMVSITSMAGGAKSLECSLPTSKVVELAGK